MGRAAQGSPSAQTSAEFEWWSRSERIVLPLACETDVPMTPIQENAWYSIRRMDMSGIPHKAQICRRWDTVLLFEKGSFVEGERRIGPQLHLRQSPLDVDTIPAETQYDAFADRGSNVICNVISFNDAQASELIATRAKTHSLQPSLNLSGSLMQGLGDRVRDLCRAASAGGQIETLYLDLLMEMLLHEIFSLQEKRSANDAPPPKASGGLSPVAQKRVSEFLREHMNHKVDLQTLAELVGISRCHFARAFKTSFGVSPYQHFLSLRVSKAAELLVQTEWSITDIANEVGFASSSEFSRTFKSTMHCSPKDYRLSRR